MKILDVLKIIISFFLAKVFKKYNSIWLISERGVDARDNGFSFFKFLNEEHDEIDSVYVIDFDSPDFERVNVLGTLVNYNSLKHGIMFFSAENLICSHPYFCKPSWYGLDFLIRNNLLKTRGKRIFLQHGIIKDMLPSLKKDKFKVDLFICGAEPEYIFVLDNFGFDKSIVKYTGLSRFDFLTKMKGEFKNGMILLMPTWRKSFKGMTKEDFLKSEYYLTYSKLLNDELFLNFLLNNNFKLLFYPHFEVQKWVNCFSSSDENVIIANFSDYDVQTLLVDCEILVTDYSSVFFDVAFMEKPVIFYQFDYNSYRENHYKEGYLDYKNSFGPVVSNIKDLVSELEKIKKGEIQDSFIEYRNNFFKLKDSNNSNRIFEEIIGLRSNK